MRIFRRRPLPRGATSVGLLNPFDVTLLVFRSCFAMLYDKIPLVLLVSLLPHILEPHCKCLLSLGDTGRLPGVPGCHSYFLFMSGRTAPLAPKSWHQELGENAVRAIQLTS